MQASIMETVKNIMRREFLKVFGKILSIFDSGLII